MSNKKDVSQLWGNCLNKQDSKKSEMRYQPQSNRRTIRVLNLLEKLTAFLMIVGMVDLLCEDTTIQWVFQVDIDRRPNLNKSDYSYKQEALSPYEKLMNLLKGQPPYLKDFKLILVFYSESIGNHNKLSRPIEFISLKPTVAMKRIEDIFVDFKNESKTYSRIRVNISREIHQVVKATNVLENQRGREMNTLKKDYIIKVSILSISKPLCDFNEKSKLTRTSTLIFKHLKGNVFNDQMAELQPEIQNMILQHLADIFEVSKAQAGQFRKPLMKTFTNLCNKLAYPNSSKLERMLERDKEFTNVIQKSINPPGPDEVKPNLPVKGDELKKSLEASKAPVPKEPVKPDDKKPIKEIPKKVLNEEEEPVEAPFDYGNQAEDIQPTKPTKKQIALANFKIKSADQQGMILTGMLAGKQGGVYGFDGNSVFKINTAEEYLGDKDFIYRWNKGKVYKATLERPK